MVARQWPLKNSILLGGSMERRPFGGAMTAIVSPFRADSKLDLDAFRRVLQSQKQSGIDGVVVAGTTGESPTLSGAEKLELLETALDLQDDGFSVYVGTGTNATESTVAEVRTMANFRNRGKGVNGVMVVAPYYNRPNQAGLALHFSAVAKAAGETPLCLYNVPARTGCTLAPVTFSGLAQEFANIVAIKEAAGDVLAMTHLRLALRSKGVARPVSVLSGDDATFPAALVTGAQGVISVTSHIIPRTIAGIVKAAQSGDLERVRALHTAAFPLSQGLFCAPNPVPVKHALSLHNLCGPYVRAPLAPLSASEQEVVARVLAEALDLGAQIL
jgi:4-hydroxy-tetrahydrodipicolinate synthase